MMKIMMMMTIMVMGIQCTISFDHSHHHQKWYWFLQFIGMCNKIFPNIFDPLFQVNVCVVAAFLWAGRLFQGWMVLHGSDLCAIRFSHKSSWVSFIFLPSVCCCCLPVGRAVNPRMRGRVTNLLILAHPCHWRDWGICIFFLCFSRFPAHALLLYLQKNKKGRQPPNPCPHLPLERLGYMHLPLELFEIAHAQVILLCKRTKSLSTS